MNILFLQEDVEVSSDAVGGMSALIYSHLRLLLSSRHNIQVLVLSKENDGVSLQACLNSLEKIRADLGFFQIDYLLLFKPKTSNLVIPWERFFNPLQQFFPYFSKENISLIKKKVDTTSVNLIWAEHFLPALFANTFSPTRMVYSHHDWLWLLARLKWNERDRSDPKKKLRNEYLKHTEEGIVCNMTACVSGSMSDINIIKKLGVMHTGYFPAAYDEKEDNDIVPTQAREHPKIVHLGGMNATANRLGLERFMQIVWPELIEEFDLPPELWVIGDMTMATDKLLLLLKKANAICPGFVRDLNTVLHPYDIHIIPWEYDTGTRTRLPLIFSNRQVLVATTASVACYREAIDGTNCVLVDDLSKMGDKIVNLFSDYDTRVALGNNARNTFLSSFTLTSQEERFNDFLAPLVHNLST